MYFFKDNMLTHPYLQYLIEQEAKRLEDMIVRLQRQTDEELDEIHLLASKPQKHTPKKKPPNPVRKRRR